MLRPDWEEHYNLWAYISVVTLFSQFYIFSSGELKIEDVIWDMKVSSVIILGMVSANERHYYVTPFPIGQALELCAFIYLYFLLKSLILKVCRFLPVGFQSACQFIKYICFGLA